MCPKTGRRVGDGSRGSVRSDERSRGGQEKLAWLRRTAEGRGRFKAHRLRFNGGQADEQGTREGRRGGAAPLIAYFPGLSTRQGGVGLIVDFYLQTTDLLEY
jgi:hypothetical protein